MVIPVTTVILRIGFIYYLLGRLLNNASVKSVGTYMCVVNNVFVTVVTLCVMVRTITYRTAF